MQKKISFLTSCLLIMHGMCFHVFNMCYNMYMYMCSMCETCDCTNDSVYRQMTGLCCSVSVLQYTVKIGHAPHHHCPTNTYKKHSYIINWVWSQLHLTFQVVQEYFLSVQDKMHQIWPKMTQQLKNTNSKYTYMCILFIHTCSNRSCL